MDSLDRKIKDKVDSIEYQASNEQISLMTAILDKRRKKRGFLIWLLPALIIMSGLFAVAYFGTSNSDINTENNSSPESITLNESLSSSEQDVALRSENTEHQMSDHLSNQNPEEEIQHEEPSKSAIENNANREIIAVNPNDSNEKDAEIVRILNEIDKGFDQPVIAKNIDDLQIVENSELTGSAHVNQDENRFESNLMAQLPKFNPGINLQVEPAKNLPFISMTYFDPVEEEILDDLKPGYGINGSLHRFLPNSSLSQDKNYAFVIGALIKKPISSNWVFAMGSGYEYRPGGFDFFKQSERKEYSFKLRSSKNNLSIDQVHMAYLSFGIERTIRKFSFAFNFVPKYVLGAKGDLHYKEHVGTEEERWKTFENVWVKTTGIKDIPVDLSLGIAYHIHKKLAIQLKASYGIHPLISELDFEMEDDFEYNRDSKNIGLGVSAFYQLN